MSSAETALGGRPHGSTAREAKSKRENAGQLSKETAAGADPAQGRLLGHLGRPSALVGPPLMLPFSLSLRRVGRELPIAQNTSKTWTEALSGLR